MDTTDNMLFELIDMDSTVNISFELTEIIKTSNMSFELTEANTNEILFESNILETGNVTTEAVLQSSETARERCNRLAREHYAQKMVQTTMTLADENMESARKCKNRLAKESYACRNITLTTQQTEHFVLTEIDTNEIYFESNELRTAKETAEGGIQNSKAARERHNRLAREYYARKMAQEKICPEDENSKSAREQVETTELAEERRSKCRKTNHRASSAVRLIQYDSSTVSLHNLGSLNVECRQCHALHWMNKKIAGT
ncbi:29009_t:CDS:2, partial [Racocetra persica]